MKAAGVPARPTLPTRSGGRLTGGRSGFTLIELVVSAALTALILVSAYLCLGSSISSQTIIESRSDALQGGRVALALMSADLRSACPLSKDIQFLGMRRTLEGAQADNIDFGTHHYRPRRPREADFCQTSYFVAREPQSGKLSLWRRRHPALAPDPLSGGSREEILRGVLGLKFDYYDGFDWYETWGDATGRGRAETSWREQPNMYGLPEAVRITLWLEPGSRGSHSTTRPRGSDDKSREPAVVLQTVARLNLAGLARPTTSGANTNAAGSRPSASGQDAPEGGTP